MSSLPKAKVKDVSPAILQSIWLKKSNGFSSPQLESYLSNAQSLVVITPKNGGLGDTFWNWSQRTQLVQLLRHRPKTSVY